MDEQDVQRRKDDKDTIQIKRDVPITWLVTIVFFGLAHAVSNHYGQKALVEKVSEQTGLLNALVSNMNSRTIKDAEHDQQIGQLLREQISISQRVTDLEKRGR